MIFPNFTRWVKDLERRLYQWWASLPDRRKLHINILFAAFQPLLAGKYNQIIDYVGDLIIGSVDVAAGTVTSAPTWAVLLLVILLFQTIQMALQSYQLIRLEDLMLDMATDEEDVTADGGTARGEHPQEPDLGGGILLACAAIGTVAGLLVSPGHGVAGMILGAVVGREYELGRLRV